METELLARIKTVFAGSWGTQETIRITRELLGSVSAVAGVAQSRYGQGRGNQQDVVAAEVERGDSRPIWRDWTVSDEPGWRR